MSPPAEIPSQRSSPSVSLHFECIAHRKNLEDPPLQFELVVDGNQRIGELQFLFCLLQVFFCDAFYFIFCWSRFRNGRDEHFWIGRVDLNSRWSWDMVSGSSPIFFRPSAWNMMPLLVLKHSRIIHRRGILARQGWTPFTTRNEISNR